MQPQLMDDTSSCATETFQPYARPWNWKNSNILVFFLLFLFTTLGFLVMGYHPGAEDDGIYLSAVKSELNPSLFHHDSEFFKLQMKTSVFDTWMADFVQKTGISTARSELLWQFISIFAILLASWTILSQLFQEASARWAGIATLSAMMTLPVAGTALFLVDQYLHPRSLATALILFGTSRIMSGKVLQAIPLVAVAFVLHPLMGALGISFCCILTLTSFAPLKVSLGALRENLVPRVVTPVFAVIPFGWIFSPPSQSWLEAMQTRHLYHLYQWTWYEWLGAIGPLVLFWIILHVARKQGNTNMIPFAKAVLGYGIFFQVFSMIILSPWAPTCFSTLEPMRYLHLVYTFLALIGGAYLGRCVLKARLWRWAVFLLLTNGGMLYAQRQLFPATEHLELPGQNSENPWLQAFAWIRTHTPQDAYFALDPNYMADPGEDYHSFRALAERSMLADNIKDTSVVTKAPELGNAWKQQVSAEAGWTNFKAEDFKRLRSEFGIDWVLVSSEQSRGLACPWHNDTLFVCHVD